MNIERFVVFGLRGVTSRGISYNGEVCKQGVRYIWLLSCSMAAETFSHEPPVGCRIISQWVSPVAGAQRAQMPSRGLTYNMYTYSLRIIKRWKIYYRYFLWSRKSAVGGIIGGSSRRLLSNVIVCFMPCEKWARHARAAFESHFDYVEKVGKTILFNCASIVKFCAMMVVVQAA